jgi:lysozyme family protein
MPADYKLTDRLRAEYLDLYQSCRVTKNPAEVDEIIDRITASETRYSTVADPLAIPWYVVAVIHSMEAGLRFTRHLHNGDPLTARTVNVPKGRPRTGRPPFTWEESARDALKYDGLDKVDDWSLTSILYELEKYNGFGYRRRGINTPYLWSFSNHYRKGRFVSDGHYDAESVSKQIGAGVLLRRMEDRSLIAPL